MRYKGSLIVFLGLVLINLISASFGIGSDYFQGAPLKIAPGSSRDVVFGGLQNVGEKELVLEAEILEGYEIASIIDSSLKYKIPPGTISNNAIPVNIRVSISETVVEGTEYNIKIKFLDISSLEGKGTVTVSQSLTKLVPVLVTKDVVEEEIKEKSIYTLANEFKGITSWILIGLIIMIVLVICFLIMRNRKLGRENQKELSKNI